MRSACLLVLFGLLTPSRSHAQHWIALVPDAPLPEKFDRVHKVDGPAQVRARELAIVAALQRLGHLGASIDSSAVHGDSAVCVLHLGRAYRWARLSAAGVDGAIASEVRFRERYFNGQAIDPERFARLYEELLDHCEDNGFPFATVLLDSVVDAGDDGLRATLVLDKGRFTRIDSVVVRGTARVNGRYLQGRIGISPGDPYSERLIAGVQQRLREMPFVSVKQRPYVLFSDEQARLYLFLDHKRASSVNGILGVLPDPVTGTVNFTGDLDLRLRNGLHRGEAIDLNWRSLKDRTQDLKLRFNLPYLFGTPFGTDLSLKIFKRDTTFLEVTTRAAIDYLHGRNDRMSAFVNNRTSERLGRNTTTQAGLADVRLTSYGLSYERGSFDYKFNPRRGSAFTVEASVGRKRTVEGIVQNGEVPPTLYSDQYEWNAKAVGHIALGGRGTVRLVAQGEGMVNDKLYPNELFRIGGIKDLRGVDEASIPASTLVIGTAELRFILEENSNAFVFFDQAWWEDQSADSLITDTPYGFGVGTSFETKAGIFMLTYALGSEAGRPLDLRESKVHFGFTSLF